MVLGPDAADRLTGVALNVVLRHELTHIAARGRTVDGSPMWILEGTADYIGYLPVTATPLTADDLRRHAPETVHRIVYGDAPSALPADEDFIDPARTLAAYEMSWTLAAHIAARFGSGTLVELYTALARGPVPPSETDRILVDVLGIPARDLVEQWHGRLEAVLGG